MTITLNDQQLKNLEIFLSRTKLEGVEVASFNELVDALFKPSLPLELIKESIGKKVEIKPKTEKTVVKKTKINNPNKKDYRYFLP